MLYIQIFWLVIYHAPSNVKGLTNAYRMTFIQIGTIEKQICDEQNSVLLFTDADALSTKRYICIIINHSECTYVVETFYTLESIS